MDTKDDNLQVFKSFINNLLKGQREVSTFLRFLDFYDGILVPFTLYVSPYLWIIPLIVMVTILVTFKKANLFGVTQKLIVITMAMDMFFNLFTGMKDGVLNFLHMNYGFVEYKVCRLLLISFRIQGIIHGSSVLLKLMMTARIVLLIAFPIKFRNFKFRKWAFMLLLIHVIICVAYFSFVLMISISPVTTVQEYKPGEPLKIIQACAIDSHYFLMVYHEIFFLILVVYFLAIPVLFQCVCIIVLSLLMKKQIKAVMNLINDKRQRPVVKYIRLMKVSLLLGISFLMQEMPQVIIHLYGFLGDCCTPSKVFSYSYFLMAISYAIGKPVDALIYSSQSKAFRTTLSNGIRRMKNKLWK